MDLHRLQKHLKFIIVLPNNRRQINKFKIFCFLFFVLFSISVDAKEDLGKTRYEFLKAINKCNVNKLGSFINSNTISRLKKAGKSVRRIPEKIYYKCSSKDFCSVLPLLVAKGANINKKTGSGEGLYCILPLDNLI